MPVPASELLRIALCGCSLLVAGAASGSARASALLPAVPVARDEGALRVVPAAEWPSLEAAFAGADGSLLTAIERSLAWFGDPSKRSPYPFGPLAVSEEQAHAGVAAFAAILRSSSGAAEFQTRLAREFDLYASVGSDGRGTVLFTGYYSPVYRASRARTAVFRFPLYPRPADLVVDEPTGRVLGRRTAAGTVPYPTRVEIERDPAALGLAGREIAWLSDRLDAYLVQVQGAAQLELGEGGRPLHVGYAGNNGREYGSLAKFLADDGKIERSQATIPAIRAYFREHPDELEGYLRRNDRFIFFRETQPEQWPVGSLGTVVTPMRTIATDKVLFPPGGVVLVQTTLAAGEGRPLEQFFVDQDAGGGIRSPGRADLYLGIGDGPGEIAGRQAHGGRLYYLLLKPERVAAWRGANR